MLCTVLTRLKNQKSLACHYSDSMGFNRGKRPSLYSDKHGGVKVNHLFIPVAIVVKISGENMNDFAEIIFSRLNAINVTAGSCFA